MVGAGGGAVGAAVVGWRQAAAVVVAEFDDHVIAFFEVVGDGGETAFARVGAGGAAGDSVVDDGKGEVGREVVAPACFADVDE